jgi:hypothetical protein
VDFPLLQPLIILHHLTGCNNIILVLIQNVGNNHMYSVSFFRVEIENTADKGSESFHPASTELDKC